MRAPRGPDPCDRPVVDAVVPVELVLKVGHAGGIGLELARVLEVRARFLESMKALLLFGAYQVASRIVRRELGAGGGAVDSLLDLVEVTAIAPARVVPVSYTHLRAHET